LVTSFSFNFGVVLLSITPYRRRKVVRCILIVFRAAKIDAHYNSTGPLEFGNKLMEKIISTVVVVQEERFQEHKILEKSKILTLKF
jgi:hypothetical protein